MAQIFIRAEAVHQQGNVCDGVSQSVQPGASDLSNGQLPNTMLDCRSAISICQDVWNLTYTRAATTLTSIANKLHTTANSAGTADVDAAAQYRHVADPYSKYDRYE